MILEVTTHEVSVVYVAAKYHDVLDGGVVSRVIEKAKVVYRCDLPGCSFRSESLTDVAGHAVANQFTVRFERP